MNNEKNTMLISKHALQRMPNYLHTLKQHQKTEAYISAPILAAELNQNEVQVRKDLAAVSSTGGKPKVGYEISGLVYDIEEFLGYHDVTDAVLVGAGHLGKALLNFQGFENYGLKIVAAFDNDPDLEYTVIGRKPLFPIEKMTDLCTRMHIRIGIIAVPAAAAQEVCDLMVSSGVQAIWNFAMCPLQVPEGIIVENESLASSLAVLSHRLQVRGICE